MPHHEHDWEMRIMKDGKKIWTCRLCYALETEKDREGTKLERELKRISSNFIKMLEIYKKRKNE